MKLWVVIGTYDKILEAQVQMEIIRNIIAPRFDDVKIVHAYNWTEDYSAALEDILVKTTNPSHFIGAANLMDIGIECIMHYDLDYILVSASDCRWTDPWVLLRILNEMKGQKKILASCIRGYPWQTDRRKRWLACDTFIIDAKREREHPIFPLDAQKFLDKNLDAITYFWAFFKLEKLLVTRYVQSFARYLHYKDILKASDDGIYHLDERVPTMQQPVKDGKLGIRNFDCPELGLYTNHDRKKKIAILKSLVKQLSEDTRYFIRKYS
jgi:hypothetical protein